ncbi:iron-containing alcohol dehydrogenase [Treponema sp.]|uniref:iron-containing alcohol dehydrogenase n=1 Tax=Treponema sp. TaxID=166 RepID=UPI003F09F023
MFVYHIPTKIYFGENQLNFLSDAVSGFGKKALLVYGGGSIKKNGVYDSILLQMKNSGVQIFELSGIEPNPKVDSVRRGISLCKSEKIDFVIAAGGGSVMDAGKFICAGACAEHDVWEFISSGRPVKKALPLFCVLTVSATGSEMDNTAVLNNPETMEKRALIDDKLFPVASFCDPALTYSVNAYQTACGSADILSHLMEVYFNRNQNLFMLDTQMEGMMRTVVKFAPVAVAEPENYEARANLMWTSTWAINGYIYGCKKNPWSCHAIEHQLSAVYDITHGLGLAIITPRWMEFVLDESNAEKFCRFGKEVFGIESSGHSIQDARRAIDCLKDFFYSKLNLKSTLSEINIDCSHFESMAKNACSPAGYINGWKKLYPDDVVQIYKNCL